MNHKDPLRVLKKVLQAMLNSFRRSKLSDQEAKPGLPKFTFRTYTKKITQNNSEQKELSNDSNRAFLKMERICWQKFDKKKNKILLTQTAEKFNQLFRQAMHKPKTAYQAAQTIIWQDAVLPEWYKNLTKRKDV